VAGRKPELGFVLNAMKVRKQNKTQKIAIELLNTAFFFLLKKEVRPVTKVQRMVRISRACIL
jgi:hypothetical protein